MNMLCLLRERCADLSDSECKLAEYMLASPDRAVPMTAAELGQAVGSSDLFFMELARHRLPETEAALHRSKTLVHGR